MQQFFVSPNQVKETEISIVGADVNHLKRVLRMKIGEELFISAGENKGYQCVVKTIGEEEVVVTIAKEVTVATELPSKIYLFQSLPKADKLEMIVQKAVELGVHEIIPVSTKRCVVKFDEKKARKKVERLNAIAESAAKQAGRAYIPQVKEVMKYEEAIAYAKEQDVRLMPYELADDMQATKETINNLQIGQSIAVFIGPEGGFDQIEIKQAKEAQIMPITLGKRILRTETAGITTLSILMYRLEQ